MKNNGRGVCLEVGGKPFPPSFRCALPPISVLISLALCVWSLIVLLTQLFCFISNTSLIPIMKRILFLSFGDFRHR